MARHPDVPARTPAPVAADPEVPGVGRRSIVLHAHRRRRDGHDSTDVSARGCHHTASDAERKSQSNCQSTCARNNTEHVNLITKLLGAVSSTALAR